MKTKPIVQSLLLVLLCPLLPSSFAQIQVPSATIKITESATVPQAFVLSVKGDCEYSEDGTSFEPLKKRKVLKEGAIIRTGENSRTDVFFRRIGTTMRVQPSSEVKLEKMTRTLRTGGPVLETLVDLKTGRIFTVVQSMVEGSRFEIRNAAGRTLVEGGGGNGRYIITADGTHVAEKGSTAPIKLIGETGITVLTPGQKYDPKEGKVFSQSTPEAVETLIEFDEMSATVEQIKFEDEEDKRK